MGQQLVAIAMAGLAQVLMLLAIPPRLLTDLTLRSSAVWMCAFVLLAFVPAGQALVVLALLLLLIAPLDNSRAAFFVLVAACLPTYFTAPMPFPGVDYLLNFSGYMVVATVVLAPMFLMPSAPNYARSITGALLVAFVLYCFYQTWGAIEFTPALRALSVQLILIVLPYFALSRAARSPATLDKMFDAVIILGIILAFVAIVSTARNWDFYQIHRIASAITIDQYRSGFLRIEATASAGSLGLLCAFAIVFLQCQKDRWNLGFIRLNFLRLILVFTAFVTGSRAGFGAIPIAFGLYYVFSARRLSLRIVSLSVIAVGAAFGLQWLATANTQTVDQQGTFSYRQELLMTSLDYIQKHFWLGDFNYMKAREFAHLLQGQGIIDITNYYLQIALQYGMVGFILFFSAYLITFGRLVLWSFKTRSDDDRKRAAATLGCFVAWFFFISTSSDVGVTLHLGMICLTFAQGLMASKRGNISASEAAESGRGPASLRPAAL